MRKYEMSARIFSPSSMARAVLLAVPGLKCKTFSWNVLSSCKNTSAKKKAVGTLLQCSCSFYFESCFISPPCGEQRQGYNRTPEHLFASTVRSAGRVVLTPHDLRTARCLQL